MTGSAERSTQPLVAPGLSVRLVLAAIATLALVPVATAAEPGQIYTCTDANGKKLTADRPIAECNAREQRVLNPDGSVKRVQPPSPTADERAELDARDREAAAERMRKQEAVRLDRNLLTRYPDEAAHRKARAAALDDLRKSLRVSEERVEKLAAERKPLLNEVEFYAGKPLPAKLKAQLDANDASAGAQRTLVQNQQFELGRINKRYDVELERLKSLWAGTPPGSMNVPAKAAASAPRK